MIFATAAAPAQAASLEEAVQRAVSTNPDVGAAAGDRRAADEQVRQARAGFFPQADTRISIGREWANTPSTRASAPPAEDDATQKNRTDASLTVRQMLFDGFETQSDVDRRRMLSESAASRVLQSSEQTGIDTVEAYIEVLRTSDVVAINRENVRTHDSYVAALQKRLDRGAGDVGDLRRAQSRLASAQGQLADAEARLKDAQSRYLRTVGEPPQGLERPVAPDAALPPDVDAGVEQAMRANPVAQRAEAEVEAARAQTRQAKSGFYPQFDVELNGQTGDNLRGVKGRDSAANALLVMRYNLSRGGADMARSQEAIERLAAANQRLAGVRRDVERDMRLAFSALRSARERAVAANNQVIADARGRDAFRRQFDLGRSRILDLLDSERDYYNSLQLRTSQEATALFGVYRVLQSAGVLLRTLRVKPPDEAFGADDTPWAAEVALARQAQPYAPPAGAGAGASPPGTLPPGTLPPELPPGLQLRPPSELRPDYAPGFAPPISPDAPAIIPVLPRAQQQSVPAPVVPAPVAPTFAPRQAAALPPPAPATLPRAAPPQALAALAPAAGPMGQWPLPGAAAPRDWPAALPLPPIRLPGFDAVAVPPSIARGRPLPWPAGMTPPPLAPSLGPQQGAGLPAPRALPPAADDPARVAAMPDDRGDTR
ncbi:MAG: TolC family outer membrane protein [Alphaproteobacteria bacterium]|nr:TolC family outer membrane protein [Alphaproteobacteria bacterium]